MEYDPKDYDDLYSEQFVGGPENMEGTPIGQYKSVTLKRTVAGIESKLTTNLPYAMTRSDAIHYCNDNWPEFDSIELSFSKKVF